MRFRIGLAFALGSAAALSACFSFGDLSGGPGDANDGGIGNDASGVDASAGDGATGDDSGSDAGPGPCPSTGGPAPVRVTTPSGTFCIDSTEVSIRQYRQFTTAVSDGGYVPSQPSYCAFNTSFGSSDSRNDIETPVTNVDWCDAYAFCRWAGKRLCGKIGGGPISVSEYGDPAKTQWLAACAITPDGGVESFPYGDTFEGTACDGLEYNDGGALVEVGSLTTCQGSTPGIFDLAGNVEEWTDDCDGTTGATDCCPGSGGGYHDTGDGCPLGAKPPTSCVSRTRADSHSDVGFRCCSD